MENLDKTDIQLLRALQRNSKLTVKELAEEVHLSTSPTFERQKRLEREGYIQRYTAVLDAEKVGIRLIVLCNIRLKQHSREYSLQFMEAVKQMDEVSECYNTSGDYDFIMKVYARDMSSYQRFVLTKLGTMECIGSLHSIFVMGEVKSTYGVMIGG